MDIDDWVTTFLVIATISAGVIFAGTLVGSNKTWVDWTMVGGALLTTIGFSFLVISVLVQNRWPGREGVVPCFGSIGMGTLLFTMGFVMDHLRYRAILRHRTQLEAMTRAMASSTEERAPSDE